MFYRRQLLCRMNRRGFGVCFGLALLLSLGYFNADKWRVVRMSFLLWLLFFICVSICFLLVRSGRFYVFFLISNNKLSFVLWAFLFTTFYRDLLGACYERLCYEGLSSYSATTVSNEICLGFIIMVIRRKIELVSLYFPVSGVRKHLFFGFN